MAGDEETTQLRAAVSCALVLEKRGFKLDKEESTEDSLKYRRGKGEIVIVNHEGKGWWDTGSSAKGDVFTLVQYLNPKLNFGQVRSELRALVGMTPTYVPAERAPREKGESIPPQQRWLSQPPVEKGSRTWTYLTEGRGLPAEIVATATKADALRQGPYGSAWFAHRDGDNAVIGFEMRGQDFRSFSRGGDKSLFRLQLGQDPPIRLAVTEAPIDAMSLAVLEGMRKDTLYVATGGGMGPGTIAAMERELTALAKRPGAIMVAATDADSAGERYATRLTALAAAANVPAQRAAPSGHNDWNDVLRARALGQPVEQVAAGAPTGAAKSGASTSAPASEKPEEPPKATLAGAAKAGASTNPPASGKPDEPPTATPADASDPVAQVLKRMEQMHHVAAGADLRLADMMTYLIQQGSDPDRRAQPRFRHNVGYTLQDLEKQTGPIALSPETRSEMIRLAGSAPGLQNQRMLALMAATASIQDGEVVREIRRVAGNIGLRGDQSTPDIQSRLDALEAKVRLAARPSETAPSPEAPGRTAVQTPSGERQPADRAANWTRQPATAGGNAGLQQPQIHYPRSALDTLLSGLRTNGSGAPGQPAETPMASRLAAFEKKTQDERDDRAIQGAIVSGRAALGALQNFSHGEGGAVISRIREAARTDPDGIAGVLAEMRAGGRFADLRGQFNTALSTGLGTANAYDRAAAALDRYGKDRSAVEDIAGRRPDAANAITGRFERMDAEIGEAAAETPARNDGRSRFDDLPKKAAELLQRAVDAVKAAVTGPPAPTSQPAASPSMSAG